MKRNLMTISAIGTAALAAALWNGSAQTSAHPDFSGEWELVSAVGTAPPEGFVMVVNQSPAAVRVASRWKEPENGQYGLSLIGLLSPELAFHTDGREDLNQAGPFVIHSKTRWDGARLTTTWKTSELMGTSFEGQWIRSVSAGGSESTVEIHADSSDKRHTDAALKFRRK